MMSPPLRSNVVAFPAPVAHDFDALDRTATAVIQHRRLLRRAGTTSALDRVERELDRVRRTLRVVSSRACGGVIATALLRAYRWTIEAASQLADLSPDCRSTVSSRRPSSRRSRSAA